MQRGAGRRGLVIVLGVMALVAGMLGIPDEHAEAGLYGPIPANAAGEPVDVYSADEALFVYVRSDIKGGRVCIVNATAEMDSASCDSPAWGSPNAVVGIGTIYTPIESPMLHKGNWKLLSVDSEGNPTGISEVFTILPCGDTCDPTFGQAEVAKWKLAVSNSFLGSKLGCVGFAAKSLAGDLGGAKDGVTAAHGRLSRSAKRAQAFKRGDLGVKAVVTQSLGEILPIGGFGLVLPGSGFNNPGEEKAKEILEDLLCAVSAMYGDIMADPPDPAFDIVTQPEFSTFEGFDPQTTALAKALDDQRAHGEAVLHAYEKFQGADASNDPAGRGRQARAIAENSFAQVDDLRRSAAELRSYAATLDALPEYQQPIVDAARRQTLINAYARIRTNGFTDAQQAALRDLGLDDVAIANFRKVFDLDPATLTPGRLMGSILREVAQRYESTIPAIDEFARLAETIADVNDPPPTITFSVERGEGRTMRFTAQAASPDDQPLGAIQWDFGDGQTGTGNPVDHTYAANGTFDVTATVHEPVQQASITYSVDVSMNGPPIAGDDTLDVVAGTWTWISPLANDTDPDGDPLQITATTPLSPAGGGSLECTTSSCSLQTSYTPGVYGFDYTIADGHGGTDTGHVTVNVTPPPNRPPVALDDAMSVASGGTVDIDVAANDADPDGDPLTYSAGASGPGVYPSCTSAGVCTVTVLNVVGQTWFSYYVSDGITPSQVATVSVDIGPPANRAPIASPLVASVPSDGMAALKLGAFDPDGDPVTFSVATSPLHGSLTGIAPSVIYTPNPGFVGTDSFTYTVSDGALTSQVATVSITVFDSNLPPTVDAGTDKSASENTSAYLDLQFADTDGTVPSWTVDWGDGTVDSQVPYHGYADDGTYTVTVTAIDDDGATASDTVVVTVTNVAPTAWLSTGTVIAGVGKEVSFNASAFDPAGTADPLSLTIDFGDGPAVPVVGNTVSHAWATPGIKAVTLTADDGDGGTATATATVEVILPSIDVGPDRAVEQGATTTYAVTGTPSGENQASWRFDWGDGKGEFANFPHADHTYPKVGTYTLTVTVTVDASPAPPLVATDTAVITVTNVGPSVGAFAPPFAAPGERVSLSGGAADPGSPGVPVPGQPADLALVWDLGDGRAAAGPSPTVTWTTPGDYEVRLTATDPDGGSTTASAGIVHVGTPPPATPDTKGTSFSLAFPPNYDQSGTLTLYLAGTPGTDAKVVVPGVGFGRDVTIDADSVAEVSVPGRTGDYDDSDPSDLVDGRIRRLAVLVRAEDEISVYGLNRREATTDAYLALPDDALGTEHRLVAYQGGTSQADVTPAGHRTTVRFTPAPNEPPSPGHGPVEVVLDKGDVLHTAAWSSDVTGAAITADGPVSVFGGNKCVFVPSNYWACDHLVEQEPPESAWGQRFVTMPLATRTGGDTFRIVSTHDGTEVRINGALVATLAAGAYHEQLIDGPAEIETSEPALVAQFSNGSTFDGATADPFMMLVTPYEQFETDYTVATPQVGIRSNFLNVVVPTDGVAGLTLDGTPVDPASFVAIGTSGFSGAQLPVVEGAHHLAGPRPFGLWVYGFDDWDSYGYPGGHALGRINDVAGLALDPPAAGARRSEQACVDAVVTDVGGAPLGGVRVDFVRTGANPGRGSAIAGPDGRARHCWIGSWLGTDTITASAPRVPDATATRTWRPLLENAAPTATGSTVSTPEDTATPVALSAADADADPLTWTIVSGPAHGTLTGAGAARTYTPATDYAGADSFTFKVSDGKATSATVTVSITVTPTDDPPVGTLDTYDSAAGSTSSVPAAGVLANDTDPDGDALTVASSTPAGHGTAIVGADGAFTYTADPGFTGVDSFTYTPRANGLDGAPVTVLVVVAPGENHAPTADDDSYATPAGAALTVPAPGLFGNDDDPDGDTLLFEGLTSDETGGVLALPGDGGFTFTPDAGFVGTFTFTYRVLDGRGGVSDPATVTVTVGTPTTTTSTTTTSTTTTSTTTTSTSTTSTSTSTTSTTAPPVNQPPVPGVDDAKTKADTPVVIDVLANDTDPEGDLPLALSAVGTPAHGTAVIAAGKVTYTPSAGYLGLDTFTYTVTDAKGAPAVGTVNLSVGPTGAAFHPITPFRILDSRSGVGFTGPIPENSSKSLQVAGVNVIPSNASAVVINVTATGGTRNSYVQLWPTGAPQPLTANVLFAAGQTIPNLATIGLGPDGKVNVYNQLGSVHVIGDVVGWYDDGSGPDLFHAITPARLLDSRTPLGGWNAPLGEGQTRDLQIHDIGGGGVPATATGVVLNVTATGGTRASYVQAYPSGVARPTTANLLFDVGQTIPNLVTTAVGANGKISLYNQLGSVHLTVDVVAWFGPGEDGRWFHPISPTRLLDSRNTTGGWNATPLGPNQERPVQITGTGVVPTDAIGFAASMTATQSTGPSYLQMYPAGVPRPTTANVLFAGFQTIPNMVTGATGTGGQIMIYNQQATVHVVLDASGYYAAK